MIIMDYLTPEFLKKAKITDVLLYLYDNPNVTKSEYRFALKMSPNTAVDAHNQLEDNGCFEKSIADKDRIIYRLSEKGKRIAVFLKLIEDTLVNQTTNNTDIFTTLIDEVEKRTPKSVIDSIKQKK